MLEKGNLGEGKNHLKQTDSQQVIQEKEYGFPYPSNPTLSHGSILLFKQDELILLSDILRDSPSAFREDTGFYVE